MAKKEVLNLLTAEEALAKFEGFMEQLDAAVKSYNEANLADKLADLKKTEKEMDDALKGAKEMLSYHVIEVLAEREDPMMEAVKMLEYMAPAVVNEKGEDGIDKKAIDRKPQQIDLLKLHNRVRGGIGKDTRWALAVEHFNFLLTCKAAKDLGIDPREVNDTYAVRDIAREIEMGKTPTSNTQILRTITNIVAMMVGEEFKPISKDVNYLSMAYSRKSRKALTITASNHKALRGLMMEICHRLVTDKKYILDYKVKRG